MESLRFKGSVLLEMLEKEPRDSALPNEIEGETGELKNAVKLLIGIIGRQYWCCYAQ